METPVTQSIAGLTPYVGGKPIEELARERGITDIVKLASNENPLGPSPKALVAAVEALREVHRYPDGAAFELRSRIAAFHDVPFEDVLHGNGSNELLELVVRTFMVPGDHIVFGQPAFSMYRVIAASHNVSATIVPTDDDLTHDLDAMLDAITPRTRVVFIDNPNNPTGTHRGRNEISAFLRAAPEHVIVVLDEAYFEYADAPDYPDGLRLRELRERLIVLRTLSKAYGLAGLRIGYGIGPAVLMGYMNRIRAPFNVNLVSQRAAIAALDDKEHLERAVALNTQERKKLGDGLTRFARRVFPSQANFILADFGRDNRGLYEDLLDQGVIVRPIPGLETHLRISVGLPTENERLLAALEKVCG